MKRTHDLFCTGTPRGPGSGRVTSIISKFIYTRLVLHLLSELTVESWTLKPQLVLHNTGKYWTTDLNSALLKAGLVEGELNEIHGREIILPYNSSSTKQPLGSIRTLCSISPPKNSSCSSAIMYLAAPKKAWFANLRKLTDSRNQDHGVRFTLQWMVINRKQWLDLPCVLQRIGVYMQRRDAYLCCWCVCAEGWRSSKDTSCCKKVKQAAQVDYIVYSFWAVHDVSSWSVDPPPAEVNIGGAISYCWIIRQFLD